jgi:hypothetical protein
MSMPTLTLNISRPLYEQLKHLAEQKQRSVEETVVDLLAASIVRADELPANLAGAISDLAMLGDDDLWRAARCSLGAEAVAQMEELHRKPREMLTDEERQMLVQLMCQYERSVLICAQAAALLHLRGHDVSQLIDG